jgi:uncharacterized protein
LKRSEFYAKYKDHVDPQSAFELLSAKMEAAAEQKEKTTVTTGGSTRRQEKSTFEEVMGSPVAKQVGRELVRGVFGMLFGSAPRRTTRRKKGGIFG